MRSARRSTAAGRRPMLVLAVAGAVLLCACSSDEQPAAITTAATTTTSPAAVTTAPTTTGLDAPPSTASDSTAPAYPGPVDPGMTRSGEPVVTALPPDRTPGTSTTAGTSGTDSAVTTTSVSRTTVTVTPPAMGPYTSAIYSDPAHWICRGDTQDVCDQSYPLTKVAADGSTTAVPYFAAGDPPIDCFYVYPTSSADTSFNSDLVADSEIGVTTYQAARFNQVCRMYVPVYRSVTLAGLSGSAQGTFIDGWNMAYADVLDAWRSYLANDNHGRPVVILSHSQGSFHVTRLLREEIDPNPAQRALVVSAILPGTSFQVASGRDVGGDTQNMPLCRRNDQFGCIITFQSYRDSDPPQPGALFGRPSGTTDAACTNPAALAGGPGLLDSSFAAGDWVLDDASLRAGVTTALVDLPGLVTAECKTTADGYRYLAITVNADPADPRADDIPGDGAPNWGLHTIDLNVTQETLIELVREQSAAYLAAHG